MKYKLLAFGCQMNKNDAERIRHYLNSLSAEETTNDLEADLFVLVACSVRQTAVDRLYGFVQKWKRTLNKDFITILTGCVNDDDKKRLAKKFTYILDINTLHTWGSYLKERFPELNNFESLESDYFKILPETSKKYSAFLAIMTGCNNFCSYCIVPYVRGRERSRSLQDVLDEAKYLIKNGAKEITLLGQNVNSYNPNDLEILSKDNPYKESHIAQLLWELNKLEGLERLHFTASHPKDMHDELIDALSLEKHLNFLHLALQSGSNTVLERMNRKYTKEDYYKIIQKIRAKNPEIALATDLIVGFSGESDKEFQETYNFYKEIEFDIAYTAKYSERKGTLASKIYKDDISLELKKERWQKMQELMENITYKKNQKFINQIVSVLFDDYDSNKKYLSGNSREMKRVIVKNIDNADKYISKIKNVKIKKADTWVLWGEIYE